jgi:hypothetical protein
MARLQQNCISIPIVYTDEVTYSSDPATAPDATAASIHAAIISTDNTTATTQLLSQQYTYGAV